MRSLIRTTYDDPRFLELIAELDADLRDRYGAKQDWFDQFNKALAGANVVLVLDGETPVGCGCYRETDDTDRVEIKRMYVRPTWRRQGIARQLLTELETWAKEADYQFARLETAIRQPESIALYQKAGYQPIAKYGPYVNSEESVCLEKALY
ncbi:GNAT family N-acetyltransferase [Fibrisoma limi]|nr:GNAT family N-acetyltransferase [Fibrisoma limi]